MAVYQSKKFELSAKWECGKSSKRSIGNMKDKKNGKKSDQMLAFF
jgi:hypothetical protein